MTKIAKNRICLWYDGTAEDAARFYAGTFSDSSVGDVYRAPGDFPSGKQGDVLTVSFTVIGIPCLGLNEGPDFQHNESFSFQVATADQAETDRYRLVQGQMGHVLANYTEDADGGDQRSRSRGRQARVRRHDDDGKDRHLRDRAGPPRLTGRPAGRFMSYLQENGC